MLKKKGISHRFNKDTKIAGNEWLRGFLKRHPDLSMRQPTSTSIARAIGFNKPQCDRFFENLSDLIKNHNFPPHAVYNMDESGISTVPNKPPKIISTKGKRCVNKISSAERGINITAVCAMSASGNFIPPAFIFARKRMKAELLDGAPPSSIGMVSDSSFINGDLFLDWLSHFKEHAKPSANNPILLILDNHASHCSLKAVEFYRNNHIFALTLPPHSSHKMQPLDRSFFNSLKKSYAAECEKWLQNHPGRAITQYQVATIFTPAYLKAANATNAVVGFRVDFLASTVTERPIPEEKEADTPTFIGNVTDKSVYEETDAAVTAPTSALEVMPNPTEVTADDDCGISDAQTSHVEKNDSKVLKVTDVAPFPKANQARSSRKRKRSEVLSSSPFKKQLELEDEDRTKKKIPPQRKRKSTKTYKKPEQGPKKKVWKCGFCDEVYREPINEDWIGCTKCKEWWHEKCTGYLGTGTFICDFCVK